MLKTWCELNGEKEVRELDASMDFRNPQYRREVFFRLFHFHTSLGIQPGLVYLYLPKLAEIEHWDMEQRLWAAFLEGCTENPCTVYYIMKHVPRLPVGSVRMGVFERWHSRNWKKLCYDIDTRYNKGHLVEQTQSYIQALEGDTQEAWFTRPYKGDRRKWFDELWKKTTKLYKFGRLTTWSYLEFVKILSGFDFEYSGLMMTDVGGSKSHRNGMLRVMGRDDLEVWKGAENGMTVHSRELCLELEEKGRELLEELRYRWGRTTWGERIGYETVESTLCCFKNCFHGYRYPNIYTDMSYDRIRKAESLTPDIDYSVFWDIRRKNLPKSLLLEYQPNDPGLTPEKQEYFKHTGKMVMMSTMDSAFNCDWDLKLNKTI